MYYLKIHEYPKFNFQDKLAEYSIIAVSRHQSYKRKLKILPYLHKAYKENHLDPEGYFEFLNEIYTHKFGKRYTNNSSVFNYEKKINEMTKLIKE